MNVRDGMILSLVIVAMVCLGVSIALGFKSRVNTPARTPSINSNIVFEKGTDFRVYKFIDNNNTHYVAISYNGSIAIK